MGCDRISWISKHLMLKFIASLFQFDWPLRHFKTSYVEVYPQEAAQKAGLDAFQNILC